MFIFTKSNLFYPVDYVSHTGRRFTVSYEMKTNVAWIYSDSHYASGEGAQGFIVGFIFVFSRANGNLQRANRTKKDTYCLNTAEFIDRVCPLRRMNKEGLKVKLGINYGKLFLKVSPKTMVDYYNDFNLHQSSPSGYAFKFSGAKRMLLQAPETHRRLCIQQRSTRFWTTGGLKMPNLMTNISSRANTHPYAYYISEFEQESADDRVIQSSHLLFKQPGARCQCLRCLHEFDKGIFGLTLNPRYVEIGAHFQCSFREVITVFIVKKAPKAYIQIVHVPQFIAYTNF